ASTRSRVTAGIRWARPSRVRRDPTSTGVGTSRPRPLARRAAATACFWNASHPTPYSVSVGSTTRSPRRTAATAAATPWSRSAGDRQSYTFTASKSATRPAIAAAGTTGASSGPLRGRVPGAPGQVPVVADPVEPPVAAQQLGHGPPVAVVVLDTEPSSGPQQPGGAVDHRDDDGEPVRAARSEEHT